MLDGIIRLLEWLFEKGEQHLFPFYIVSEYEGGVLLRLGKYKKNLKKGPNWKIPLFDVALTTHVSIDTMALVNINVTTTDGKAVTVSGVIEYQVEDVKKYLIDMNEAQGNINDLSRGIIADYLSDCNWEEVKDKKTLTKIKNKLKTELEDLGVNIRKLLFADIVQTRVYTLIKDI